MYLLYYYLRARLASWRRGSPYRYTACGRGARMYKADKSDNKKSHFQIYSELNSLCKYWKGFPDTYFIFAMYRKDFTGMDRMRSFIPQCAYGPLSKSDNPSYNILIDDKLIFHELMSRYGLPVPVRYFSYSHGLFKSEGKMISDAQVDEILASLTDDRIFVKRSMCGCAKGVSLAIRKEDGYYTKEGKLLTAKSIREIMGNQEYCFERQIVQDEFMSKFNPDTVNTCRVLTYKDKVVACNMRIGRKGAFVDNAVKGGIVVSVDIDTGCLSDYGQRQYDPNKYYEHADSHIAFKGQVMPQWPAVKELVERTCKVLPYFNSVGFDVACTPEGPVIVEINTGTGVNASQMGMERGIADRFGL